MDPFSLAVGVAGLLGLVGKIIELTSKYTKGVKHAAAAASELLDTLETLGSVLSRLDGLLKDDTKQAFPSTSALATSINACRNKLIVVHTKLEETAKHPSKRLLWPLSSNNHQETLRDLRTCAQWIQFALTIDGSTLMAKTSDEVVQVLGNQLDMFHRVGSLETNVHTTHKVVVDTHRKIVDLDAASRRGKILDWISNDKAEQKHHEIRLPRLTGTGAWLLQDSSFELWRDQTLDSCESPSVLWCYGIPGSGKSILAYNLHHLSKGCH